MARVKDESSIDPTEKLNDPRPASPEGARLVIFGEAEVMSIPLPERGAVRIGRGSPSEIVVEDKAISRVHTMIGIEPTSDRGTTFWVRDLGSSNGTRVRGRTLGADEKIALEPGDPVEIGRSTMVVQRGAPSGDLWTRAVEPGR